MSTRCTIQSIDPEHAIFAGFSFIWHGSALNFQQITGERPIERFRRTSNLLFDLIPGLFFDGSRVVFRSITGKGNIDVFQFGHACQSRLDGQSACLVCCCIENELSKSTRFRFHPFYLFLFLSVCLMAIVYWWSSLTSGIDLFISKALYSELSVPLRWDEDGNSKSNELMTRAGVELRSRIEERLQKEGFVKRGFLGDDETELFVGSYRGTPRIELKLSDGVGINEGGVFYRISADYHCKLPRSTLRYQNDMSDIFNEFYGEVASWFHDCRKELANEHPEFLQ